MVASQDAGKESMKNKPLIMVDGRGFERSNGSCHECVFRPKVNNTLTKEQKLEGCMRDSKRPDGKSCVGAGGNYREVGVPYGKAD